MKTMSFADCRPHWQQAIEAHKVCALTSLEMDLAEALTAIEAELNRWHEWQRLTSPTYPDSDGCKHTSAVLTQARTALAQVMLPPKS